MPGKNIFRPTSLKDAAFQAVSNAPGLKAGGKTIDSSPVKKIVSRVAVPLFVLSTANCAPIIKDTLTSQGIPSENIKDPWIFPNDKSDPKNPLDNAKSVEFVMYTNPKDNLPYLAVPTSNEGTSFEQRQVKLMYLRDEADPNKIAEVNMVIADDENPQGNWWQDINARTTVVSLKLNQPLTEDVLKTRTDSITNDDIIGENPLFSQIFAINPFTGEAITVGLPPESTDVVQNELLAQKVALLVTGKSKLSDQKPLLTPIVLTPTAEAPTAIPTPIPIEVAAPTEAPVEVIELDKPMTTEFDLLNTEVMPSTDEEMVRSGDLNEAVRQYWQEIGIINPDGSVNKPENLIPAQPDWWKILTYAPMGDTPGGDMDLGAPSNEYAPPESVHFQPTDLLFKVKNKAGEITGVLVTELLYYIDPRGQVAVEPVFFFVDISKTSNPQLPILFGHEAVPGAGDGGGVIALPYVGVEDGEEGNEFFLIRFIENKDDFLAEPMQEEREAFARQVDATGNPKGMGNFWWAPTVAAIVPP